MNTRKITQELLDKMTVLRQAGASYSEIMERLGVTKWSCTHYLRDIAVGPGEDRGVEWKKAENEAPAVLKVEGFEDILDLNGICNMPAWDYYAKKNGERWLIDVTVNPHKSINDKAGRIPFGFHGAILYKGDGHWNMMELSLATVFKKPIT